MSFVVGVLLSFQGKAHRNRMLDFVSHISERKLHHCAELCRSFCAVCWQPSFFVSFFRQFAPAFLKTGIFTIYLMASVCLYRHQPRSFKSASFCLMAIISSNYNLPIHKANLPLQCAHPAHMMVSLVTLSVVIQVAACRVNGQRTFPQQNCFRLVRKIFALIKTALYGGWCGRELVS